jgi:hypothetical protein
MKNEIALKVYNIDYSFIIKNYLNPKLWKEKWCLFEFEHYTFTIYLQSISTRDESITFYIEAKNPFAKEYYRKTHTRSIDFSLKVDNLKFLKNKINSTIYSLINDIEQQTIKDSSYCNLILDGLNEEKNELTEIAKAFLDENGVSNSEIREVYIDNYVSNNNRVFSHYNAYVSNNKFNYLTPLWVTFANVIKDKDKIKEIKTFLQDDDKIKAVMKESKEYLKYLKTEEWKEEMMNELFEI